MTAEFSSASGLAGDRRGLPSPSGERCSSPLLPTAPPLRTLLVCWLIFESPDCPIAVFQVPSWFSRTGHSPRKRNAAEPLDGINEQVASGKADRALKAGDIAPALTLKDPEGAPVSSPVPLVRGPLVISFHRGVWRPYCNLELQPLEAARAEIEARGASLVSVSMQNAVNSRKSTREN